MRCIFRELFNVASIIQGNDKIWSRNYKTRIAFVLVIMIFFLQRSMASKGDGRICGSLASILFLELFPVGLGNHHLSTLIRSGDQRQGGLPWWLSGKEFTCKAGDAGWILGSGRSPGGGNATHSSILTWEVPWTEEPGGLRSMGSQRVRHDWATEHARMHVRRPRASGLSTELVCALKRHQVKGLFFVMCRNPNRPPALPGNQWLSVKLFMLFDWKTIKCRCNQWV